MENLTILAIPLQQLLSRFPEEYLYGCVGADMVFAKKYTRAAHRHCHEWIVGWKVLRAARSDRQRAFAYGYLSHLAADVFSHNHFVPLYLVSHFSVRTAGHAYWEALFDVMQDPRHRNLVASVRGRFPECDRLARRVVSRTIFSFDTNQRIFRSVLAFHDWDSWHRIMTRVGTHAGHGLDPETIEHYNALCLEAIRDMLQNGPNAACQSADPIGAEALSRARTLRQTLRAIEKNGRFDHRIRTKLNAFKTACRSGVPRAGRGNARGRR